MKSVLLIFALVLKLVFTPAHAEVCADTDISKLEACSVRNYRIVDQALGKKYHQLMEESDGSTQKALILAEKSWINYKEKSCEINGNAGAEASLDKLGCLIKLSKLRSDELSYLSNGIGMFGFFSHLAFEAADDSVNREIVIEKLTSKFASSKDSYWRSYVAQNCKMTSTLLAEDQNMCVARLTFYKN